MGSQDGDGFTDDPYDPESPTVGVPDDLPRIDGFETIAVVGEGGMGRVFLARDTTLDRLVAIKLISDDRFTDAKARGRFLREAKAMATVEHPHVVRVYEFGEKDGRDFIVMEYVEGESLADRIRRVGKLSVDESLGIVLQTIDGLGAAWGKGVVHRDVKLSNILLDENGSVRVADFGIARSFVSASETTITSSGAVLGTPQYMSPEQALGKAGLDFRADIYSLGIALFQLLTGGHPYPSNTPAEMVDHHLHTPLPSPRDRNPEIPESVEQLLFWMTQKDRTERPESYDALAARVRSILDGDTKLRRVSRPDGRPGFRMVVLLVLLAMTVLGAVVVSRNLRQARTERSARAQFRIVLAPLYASTARGAEDAAVMRDLLFASMEEVFRMEADVRLLVPESVRPPRTEESAIVIGDDVYADVILWGRVLALDDETVIEPMITLHPRFESSAFSWSPSSSSPMHPSVDNAALEVVRSSAGKISVRRAKAEEIRDVAVVLSVSLYFLPRGEYDTATRLLAGARTTDARILEGKIFEAELDWDNAAMSYQGVLDSEPENADAMIGLADVAFKTGRCGDAIGLYQRGLSLSGGLSSSAWRNFGLAYGSIGRTDEMFAVWQDKLRAGFDWRFTPGTLSLVRDYGRFESIVSYLTAGPSIEGLGYLLAQAYCGLGKYDEALAAVDAQFDWRMRALGLDRSTTLSRIRGFIEVAVGIRQDIPISSLPQDYLDDPRAQSKGKIQVLAGRPLQALEEFAVTTRTAGNWEYSGELDPLLAALYLAGDVSAIEAACSEIEVQTCPSAVLVCSLAMYRQGRADQARSMLDSIGVDALVGAPANDAVKAVSGENASQSLGPERPVQFCFPVDFPRRACQVAFYTGVIHLVRGDREGALVELERAAETRLRHLLEWRLAMHELERERPH